MPTPRPPRASRPARPPRPAPLQAGVNDTQREALQVGLERLPEPLEPLDISTLDGFLCGVLLQPRPINEAVWLAHVFDIDARPVPAGCDIAPLSEVIRQRHRELNQAIEARQWFDPWIFELDDLCDELEAVYPWVAGFATALTLFPALSERSDGPHAQAFIEPMALIYRHLDPDDLEDADDLVAEIDTLEPPANLSEAVEGLVRATLLLADRTRPLSPASAAVRPGFRSLPRRGTGHKK